MKTKMILSFLFAAVTFSQIFAEDANPFAGAKTRQDVETMARQEMQKMQKNYESMTEANVDAGNMLLKASERLTELAKSDDDRGNAAAAKYQGLTFLIRGCSEQKKDVSEYEKQLPGVLEDLEKYSRSSMAARRLLWKKFDDKLFASRPRASESWDEAKFDSLLKEFFQWALRFADDRGEVTMPYIRFDTALFGRPELQSRLAKEWTAFVQSDAWKDVNPEVRKEALRILVAIERQRDGSDPKLYGRTFDNEVFDWNAYRGKVILIDFTASWCGPCKQILPMFKKTYEKYHDKGFEVVSVYVDDTLEASKRDAKQLEIPWILLSEELSKQAGLPRYTEEFGFLAVPLILLCDQQGKIVTSDHNKVDAKVAELLK
ncbi:MAG: TlpA family protein disulfide reductase [Planctomycetaceae bacterium]|jgi:thiol-disulfide isomerase/thioredoxin|nr:TlpA family protein disulfide reductase [Planctomycetaceae bacterium]